MPNSLNGNMPIKIEFEDDDFKLSSADFTPDGKFRCQQGLILKRNNFKAVAIINKSNLVELICNIEGNQNGQMIGSYSLVKETSL